jgi:hypothetical protein
VSGAEEWGASPSAAGAADAAQTAGLITAAKVQIRTASGEWADITTRHNQIPCHLKPRPNSGKSMSYGRRIFGMRDEVF